MLGSVNLIACERRGGGRTLRVPATTSTGGVGILARRSHVPRGIARERRIVEPGRVLSLRGFVEGEQDRQQSWCSWIVLNEGLDASAVQADVAYARQAPWTAPLARRRGLKSCRAE